jgi:predicted HTH transcriptional regulator
MSAQRRWEWVRSREEGQFLERKSCYDRSSGESQPRPAKNVLQDIAATLVAMANADGGTIVVGVEDDGTVTGVPSRYDFQRARKQLDDYIRPRLKFRMEEISLKGQRVWVFETDWSPQEAIVNAVAHRDYRLEGVAIEVHLFDDRMEFWSPGELVEPVTLEKLRNRERVHASRNPRIVRVLTEFGYMRELGEGIPRMFEVVEREGLHPPEFRLEGGRFVVTLRSTPVYRPETMRWLQRFEGKGLSRNQIRLLAYAHERGNQFTSRAYQKLVGVDPYIASKDIQDLIRKGIVRRNQSRGRVYTIITESDAPVTEKPPELVSIEPILRERGFVKNEDIRRVLGISRLRAFRLLQSLTERGFLKREGKGRGARYVPSEKMHQP